MSSRAHTVVNPAVETVTTSPGKKDLLQRTCACGATAGISGDCVECQKHRLQRQPSSNAKPPQAPPIVHDVLRLSGQPLDASARAFFEARFGHDFSRVRIHADAEAAKSAAAVNAIAYTAGEHIVFQTGRYAPSSPAGRRLLAHELTHVVQQSGTRLRMVQEKLEIGAPGDQFEIEADRIADRVVSDTAEATPFTQKAVVDVKQSSATPQALLQRIPGPNTCPTDISFSTGTRPVHVPLCGIANVRANTVPANIPGISWSLSAGTAQVDGSTSINANGEITFGANQTGGTLDVTGENTVAGGCNRSRLLTLHSHPTGISSTFVVGPPPAAAANYGALFDHNFTSADGQTSSLENVPVGEEFSGVPNPTATVHVVTGTPFGNGNFTLNTANLTPNATNNWVVTGGSLGGRHDRVTIGRAGINVGEFLASASNPTPANTLPAGFTLTQGLFWFCRQAAAALRWTRFADVDHVRTLRLSGSNVEFVVTMNGEENIQDYTGHPAIINARADPATIPPTPPRPRRGPAPTPSTTQISADTLPDPLPARHGLRFSIRGNARGSRIGNTSGLFTAGPNTGRVTVRVSDSAPNPNFDEVVVTIANPAQQPSPPGQPQPGQQPGQQPGPQPNTPPTGQQGQLPNVGQESVASTERPDEE